MWKNTLPTLMRTLGAHKPEVMRVVPVNIKTKLQQQVHRYQDVVAMMEHAKSFQVVDCICRKEQALQGNPCKHSVEVCLSFSGSEGAFDRYPKGRIISKQEALEILEKAEEEGLVHSSYNVRSGQMFVCNCCSCCCGIMRGVKEYNAPFLMAKSDFFAEIDQDTCAACGVCADERCPMDAIVEQDGSYSVQPERCIGCGVCVPTCPTESITLVQKPEQERDEPPQNIVDWYFKRCAESRDKPNAGLARPAPNPESAPDFPNLRHGEKLPGVGRRTPMERTEHVSLVGRCFIWELTQVSRFQGHERVERRTLWRSHES